MMPCYIGLTLANFQNNHILCNNREKLESICSICICIVGATVTVHQFFCILLVFKDQMVVKFGKGILHNLTKHINCDFGLKWDTEHWKLVTFYVHIAGNLYF